MKNHRVVLTLLVALGMAACGGRPAGSQTARSEVTPVKVRRVQKVSQPARIAASGSVEPDQTVKVAFQVAGKVARVLVEEGAAVRAGQLLAELDSTDYRFGADAAAAQTGMARAALDKAQTGARVQEVERARAAYEQAADEYARLKKLYERKSLAPSDFIKIEAHYLGAKAQYEEAREGARREDKAAAKAALEQAQAGERVARKRLDDTRLLAPLAGLVAHRMVEAGESIGAGMPAFVIIDLEPAKVRVGVPESDIRLVRVGQAATILAPALPGQSFEGRVEQVGVAAEPASRTYSVKIAVPNPRLMLKAGMIAEAQIRSDTRVEAKTLPGEAVVRDPQGATLVYVYFPKERRVYARRVEVGTVYGREVEIRGGLAGDEQVVTGGQNRVREGALVEAVEERP